MNVSKQNNAPGRAVPLLRAGAMTPRFTFCVLALILLPVFAPPPGPVLVPVLVALHMGAFPDIQ